MYVFVGMPILVVPQHYNGMGTTVNSSIEPVVASKRVSIQKVKCHGLAAEATEA